MHRSQRSNAVYLKYVNSVIVPTSTKS